MISGVLYLFRTISTAAVSYTWAPNTATWYHVFATRIGTLCSLYINGELKATGTDANQMGATAAFRIGNYGGGEITARLAG